MPYQRSPQKEFRRQSRKRASPWLLLTALISAVLLGTSASQLWAHHPDGWGLFVAGIIFACLGWVL
jgi:hypothetical protein